MTDNDRRDSGKDMRYSLEPTVRVTIRHIDTQIFRLADDRGFLRRFLDFCHSEQISQLRGVTMGPGTLVCDLVPADCIDKVAAWLKKEGAQLDEENED